MHVTTHDVAEARGFERSLIGAPLPHLSAAGARRLAAARARSASPASSTSAAVRSPTATGDGSGLTAAAIPAGSVRRPGGRLYRTGDLARRLPDGGLEYLGRCDDPGEDPRLPHRAGRDRARPGRTSGGGQRVVTVHEPQPGDRRLAGYVTVSGAEPDYPELREFLAGSLPDYMIPATRDRAGALPMTVNGKVDRAALPAPVRRVGSSAAAYVAPRTAQERLLADSLGATCWTCRTSACTTTSSTSAATRSGPCTWPAGCATQGWTVSLPELFAAPTPAALGPLLRPVDGAAPGDAVPFGLLDDGPGRAAGRAWWTPTRWSPCSSAMIFHMELSGDAGGYHNVNSYRVAGRLDEAALAGRSPSVIARHPVLRTSLDVSTTPQPLQLVHGERRRR